MATRNIQISLSGKTISYTVGGVNADQFHIKPTNKITWKCDDGDYTILFKDGRSPFKPAERAFAAHKGKKTTAKLIKDFVFGENPFSYAVTVIDPTDGQAVLDDPDLIIDDPGGGGGGQSSRPKKRGSATKKKTGAKKKR